MGESPETLLKLCLSTKLPRCFTQWCATTRTLYLEITRDRPAEEVISVVCRFIILRLSSNLFIRDNFDSFMAAEVKDFLRKNRIKGYLF